MRLVIARNCAACPLETARAARSDPFLEDSRRRIHDPGVDIPELLKAEQCGGVIGAVENVGCGLINRHCPGVRCGIRRVPGMKGARIETEVSFTIRHPFNLACPVRYV
jgi:hypothetical protein